MATTIINPIPNGSITPAQLSQPYTQNASFALSGVSTDATGIPSWVTEIHLKFAGLSTNGTSIPILQLGGAGGIEATGYSGSVGITTNVPSATATFVTTGLALAIGNAAASILNGTIIISRIDSSTNLWSMTFVGSFGSGGAMIYASADKSLSQTLDRIRLTTVAGTDSFDGGTVSLSYQ